MKATIAKCPENDEHISTCRGCHRLRKIEEGKKTYEVECDAEDRFDCPYLSSFYAPEELAAVQRRKSTNIQSSK